MRQESGRDNSEDVLMLRAVYRLLGAIPQTLQAVSVELNCFEISFRCYFDIQAVDSDIELLGVAAAELISDYPEPFILNDTYVKHASGQSMSHLKRLVFLRHEKAAA